MISALIGPVSAILDKVIPDTNLKEKLSHEIATMAERHTQEQVMAQIEVKKLKQLIIVCLLLAGDLLLVGYALWAWLATF